MTLLYTGSFFLFVVNKRFCSKQSKSTFCVADFKDFELKKFKFDAKNYHLNFLKLVDLVSVTYQAEPEKISI